MSHYIVAVFTEPDGASVDELLAPFDENISVEPYIRRTKQQIIDEARETKERVLKRLAEHPEEIRDYDKPYLEAETDEELYQAGCWSDSDYDEDGNELTTYNPDSKWDWYVVGGRWDGTLKTKDGSRTNSALVSELDLTPDKEAYKDALRFWEVAVEGDKQKEDEHYFTLYSAEYYIRKYGDKESYAKAVSAFTTYACLMPDGTWCEPGAMGWWGMSGASPEEEGDWVRDYKKNFLDKADPDWCITLVDCHI